MKFTDTFIKRPVLAIVVSLMIVVLGFMAYDKLDLRQYPKIEMSVITISTTYVGASAALMQGFVTVPVQQAVADVDGIDFMESATTEGSSVVTLHLNSGYDANIAQNEVSAKIQSVRYKLPSEINDPVIQKADADGSGIFYVSYYSDRLDATQITDYLARVVQPKLQTLPGVAGANILGARNYAMRLWLDPVRMVAHSVSPTDITNALNTKNVQAAPGNLKGKDDVLSILATTDVQTVEEFKDMVIANDNGTLVRIKDVATVELGAENYDLNVLANGRNAVVIMMTNLPSANPLDVVTEVRDELKVIEKQLPPDLHQTIIYDVTTFIHQSIDTVQETLVEAVIIVLVVIFLFLGTLRAVLIPIVTIPLSLIGILYVMYLLGFSINVLTLLAMVLAIGLVVDDAIVVVENINRHLEEGAKPFAAAIHGAREIAVPVISMTITLAAVYTPIAFITGLTGQLFIEFAFTLAGAVIISGIVALTLSPMMSSKLLNEAQLNKPFVKRVDKFMAVLCEKYQARLASVIKSWRVVLFTGLSVVGIVVYLYMSMPAQLAPNEDQNAVVTIATGPTNSNIDFTSKYMGMLTPIYNTYSEMETNVIISGRSGVNTGLSFMVLKPPTERTRSQQDIINALRGQYTDITGMNVIPVQRPTLPGTDVGYEVLFVLTSIDSYQALDGVAQKLIKEAYKSGYFTFVTTDLKLDYPKLDLEIDRNLASDLGVTPQDVANALAVMVGENNVTRFNLNNRSYEVIPQVKHINRMNPLDLANIFVKASSGQMIPLAAIMKYKTIIDSSTYNQFQELNSATVEGKLMPGVAIGDALAFLASKADEILPDGMSYSYAGQSRQYIEQGNEMLYAMAFALIIIFLVLAAQFNTFREPLIILTTFFFSAFGALLALTFTKMGTINIFTQIGLLTLIGLISKHGILIVEFSNQLQEKEGLSVYDAVIKASTMRLRPILMTTAAMVFGMVPLLFSNMGLVQSQFQLALTIIAGMLVGTGFTIFVVPTLYYLVAKDKRNSNIPEID